MRRRYFVIGLLALIATAVMYRAIDFVGAAEAILYATADLENYERKLRLLKLSVAGLLFLGTVGGLLTGRYSLRHFR